MLFNSLEFAVFYPLVAIVYFLLPHVWRVRWLLVSSCLFYMAFIPEYICILFITIFIDYSAGRWIEQVEGWKKKTCLWTSVASTCLVLFVFKYLNFMIGSYLGISRMFGAHPTGVVFDIILPVGLSFHTFQSLSYVIEVYRGHQRAERNLVVYATYVMFFPQLVAGPIERPQNLLHQFREYHHFEYASVTSGLKRIAWGMFKKVVIADRLALYVNDVYSAPRNHNGLQLSLATVFFTYQIYCDFSGYSDIAVGSAQVLGFRLMENFRTPYYSQSVSEFWRRWHISLSTWFRDYVYFPLGGSRVGRFRHITNLIVTFVASGLWHGANWTYACWGLLNGLYLVVGFLTASWRNQVFACLNVQENSLVRRGIRQVSTFVVICLAWIVFRARNLSEAAYVFSHLTSGWNFHNIRTEQFLLRQMLVALAAMCALELGQVLSARSSITHRMSEMQWTARWGLYIGFAMLVIMFGIYRKTRFIYFQF